MYLLAGQPLYCKAPNGKFFVRRAYKDISSDVNHRDSLLMNCSKRWKLKLTRRLLLFG